MKKILVSVFFIIMLTSAWSQSLYFFPLLSLEMNKEEVLNVLKTEFKGKYSLDNTGIYAVSVSKDKKVYITIIGEKVYTLRVVIHDAVFSQFVICSREIIGKYGEPDTCMPNGFEYRVDWYGKDDGPGRALIFSDEAPYRLEEIVTYEK